MKLNKILLTAGFAAILALGTCNVIAQDGPPGGGPGGQGGPGGGPGGMDFSQMRQRMIDNYREQLGVKDDAEWKVLESQIVKVMEARRDVGFGGRGFGMMRPPRNGNTNSPAGAQGQNRPRGPFGQQSPAAEALQKALDAKASAAEIKTKLAAYRAEVKAKEDKLTAAQEELKKLLTPQQEAVAVLGGLLK